MISPARRYSGLGTLNELGKSRFDSGLSVQISPYYIDLASGGYFGIDATGVSFVEGVFSGGTIVTPSNQVGNNRRVVYSDGTAVDLVPAGGQEGLSLGAANLLAATNPGSSNPNFIVQNWALGGQAWVGSFDPATGVRYSTSLSNWSGRISSENITNFLSIYGLNQFVEEAADDSISNIISRNTTFFAARESSLLALTGQSTPISKFHPIPGYPGRNSGAAGVFLWGLAIEDMCYTNNSSGYFTQGPLYPIPIGPDAVHPTAAGQIWKNEMYGKALRQIHLEGYNNWTWMRMQSAVASGNNVIITVNVPALERNTAGSGSPVIFDSSGIIPAGVSNQGFRYDANGSGVSRNITSVSLGSRVGNNFTIIITLDGSAPTSTLATKVNGVVPSGNAFIGYADFGGAPYAPATPPRGYVRDSESVTMNLSSGLTINGVTPGSWNWLVPGQQQIV